MLLIIIIDSHGGRPAVSFLKEQGRVGGTQRLGAGKQCLYFPFLGPWSFGWYPNPQESGGAWVAQVLVWALGAFIHWTHFLVSRRPAVSFLKEQGRVGGTQRLGAGNQCLYFPFLGPWSFGWYPNPQDSGGAWVAQVLVWALGAFIHWTHFLVIHPTKSR